MTKKIEISFLIRDPCEIENHYQLSVIYLDTVYIEQDSLDFDVNKRNITIWTEDNSVEEGEGNNSYLLFSDYIFDGQEYKLKMNFREFRPRRGRQYFIELISMNRSGYLYKRSITEYTRAPSLK